MSFEVRDKVAQFEIYSTSGIGKARIRHTSTPAPQEVLLNFHLRALEHLTFSFGEQSVEIEIPSSGDHEPIEAFPPDSALWMPVKIFSRDNAYPIQDGTIQVQPPRAFYESDWSEFSIEWIDFYR